MARTARPLVWLVAAGFVLFSGYRLNDATHRFEGIVGMTKKNGYGCFCHNEDPTLSVQVWIEGPDTVAAGTRALYTLYLQRDSTVTGGFNVATQFGILGVVESLYTYWYEDELTHLTPRPANGTGMVSWQFSYTAPDIPLFLVDTLFSAANSTNQDTMATDEDKWNFGDNFLVTVVGATSVSPGEPAVPASAVLYQNFPNPFNPSTTIRFDLAADAFVSIDLYDLTGRLVRGLTAGEYGRGNHELRATSQFDGLASGTYLYRMSVHPHTAPPFTETRKLVLVR